MQSDVEIHVQEQFRYYHYNLYEVILKWFKLIYDFEKNKSIQSIQERCQQTQICKTYLAIMF